tara:strand:- start:447 stop:1247 length:801 start_codon:yes stop_codon:yes gene_type:complete
MENEHVVEQVLERYPWLSLKKVSRSELFPGLNTRPGRTDFTKDCIRVWNDENDGSGFFIAVFTQDEEEQTSARATRAHPRDLGKDPTPISAKPLGKMDLRLGDSMDLQLFSEWGMETHGLTLWRRGQYAHVSMDAIREWLWDSPRLTGKHQLYPGGHWQPLRVLQAGQPVWKIRKERNRFISTGVHGLAERVTNHCLSVERALVIRLLDGEEPGRSTLTEAFQGQRDGGVLLQCEDEFIPAWLAGKLSLMMTDAEQHILRLKLGLL